MELMCLFWEKMFTAMPKRRELTFNLPQAELPQLVKAEKFKAVAQKLELEQIRQILQWEKGEFLKNYLNPNLAQQFGAKELQKRELTMLTKRRNMILTF